MITNAISSGALCARRHAALSASACVPRWIQTLSLATIVLLGTGATAATRATGQNQARYQAERAACMNASAQQDRANCLRDAAAAYQEIKAGRLNQVDKQALGRNRSIRCDPLPAADRQDCQRRMQGEGSVSGSVEGGGLYRELVSPVIAAPAN